MPIIQNLGNMEISEKALFNLCKAGYIDIYLDRLPLRTYDRKNSSQYTFIARTTLIKTIAGDINRTWWY